MKGLFVILIMVLVNIWTAQVSEAMGKADQREAEGISQNKEKKGAKEAETFEAVTGDEEVAENLEMLQFMEMLEHFELIRDLDVLEGGGER